jgi:hypothetical protein
LSERSWASLSREHLADSDDDQSSLDRPLEKQSLFRDLCQTQLSLWTFAASTLLTYFWQKRVGVRSILFASCALGLLGFLSGVLASVVTLAHLFNSDFAGSFGCFGDWLNDEDQKYPRLIRRQSSTYGSKSRRSSGSGGGGSGTVTPRSGDNNSGSKNMHQARFWQKNVSLERTYIGGSSTRS